MSRQPLVEQQDMDEYTTKAPRRREVTTRFTGTGIKFVNKRKFYTKAWNSLKSTRLFHMLLNNSRVFIV
jgi:hypothetical protein